MRNCLHPRLQLLLILLLGVLLVIPGCQFLSGVDLFQESQPTPTIGATDPNLDGWYAVYFTEPGGVEAAAYDGGPGEAIAKAIDQARISVDVAAYGFNLWDIRDALLDAHRRGVTVRFVIEGDNIEREEVGELAEAGISVKGDRSGGLMHNKFFIIDRLEVWTGSMNPTLGGAYFDNNNMLRIRSPQLAENYSTEFEEMFLDSRFGQASSSDTPYATTSIDGTQIETYFSPEDGTARRIVELIASAQESVYFLAYSFTSDDIAAAMIERADHGVTVAGVMEHGQYKSNTGTEYDRLYAGGVDVRLDGNPENMHHKVIVIDEAIVITGSYNFSASAENKNDENTLIIHNREIAARYLEEFRRVYNEGY